MSSKVSASIQSKKPGKRFLAAALSSKSPCESQNLSNSVLKKIVDKEWSSVYIYMDFQKGQGKKQCESK